jgi:hypothetical protein
MAEVIEHIYGPIAEPWKIKVEKGQKNTYAWEISYSGKNPMEMISKISEVDKKLRQEFGPIEA